MNELIEFTDKEKKIIKKQFFPVTATVDDMVYCMNVASSLGLNPILKEIYFVERKFKSNGQWLSKIEPLVGRDGRLKIAHSSGAFDGMESWTEYKKVPMLSQNGWQLIEELVGCCKVFRKDMSRPFYVEVPFYEYAQKTKDGYYTSIWKDKPLTMIKKVAESQALGKAFNINGVVDEFAANEVEVDTITNNANNKSESIKDLLSGKEKEDAEDIEVEDVKAENVETENSKVEDNEPVNTDAEIEQEEVQEI